MKSDIYKGRKYAIGRGTRVKHSTSMEWDEVKKKRRKYPVIYSTGEEAPIVHSTGTLTDQKSEEIRKKNGGYRSGGAKHPGFTYKDYRKSDESDESEQTS